MMGMSFPRTLIVMTLLSALLNAPAQAQLRVFVGAQGSDANPCTFAQPCRSFNRAASVVAPGGEIDVLDPAGYGSLSITKSLSVQGHGFAGISPAAAASSGVFIAAGPNDKVFLNGLIIEGQHFGATGIGLSSVGQLIIENCVVRNWVQSGIGLAPTGSTYVNIFIANTVVAQNGGDGIYRQPTNSFTASLYANFNRVEAYENYGGVGIGLFGNVMTEHFARIVGVVVDSVAALNRDDINNYAYGGFLAQGNPSLDTENTFLYVFRSTAYDNFGPGVY